MKTDPNKSCANCEERLLWALLHDAVAHPLMGLTNYSKWSLRFHDFTSRRAWPRSMASFVFSAEDEETMDVLRQHLRTQGKSFLTEGRPTPKGYEYRVKVLA
jgi:hypothetical protein